MLQEHRPLMGERISAAGQSTLNARTIEDCARFSLRIAPGDAERAGRAFGCRLPGRVGSITDSGERLALLLGPDEWQLYAPLGERDAIEAKFVALYPKCTHSLVDIGHREIGIAVEGSATVLALRSACPLDLDAMADGTATRTIFDKAQIVLIRHGRDRFRIEVWHSFASHVWAILGAAAREIELGI